jgi:hypothetical protein
VIREGVWLHPLVSRADSFSGLRTHSDLGLRRLNRQIPHTDQVVGGGREGEDPSHLENPAMPNFPQQSDRLQPAEALFHAFPFPLADGISGVVRGASIKGTSTGSLQVLGDVRRDL